MPTSILTFLGTLEMDWKQGTKEERTKTENGTKVSMIMAPSLGMKTTQTQLKNYSVFGRIRCTNLYLTFDLILEK